MSNIIRAINSMIEREDLLEDVIQGSTSLVDEIFFSFDNKHKWSIFKDDNDGYNLIFYPEGPSIKEIAKLSDEELRNNKSVHYYEEFKTKTGKESINELYLTVKEKLYGMDSVLKEIIRQADDLEDEDIPF